MPSRNAALSVVLGVLLVSLVAIYMVTLQRPFETGLSVVLLAVCLIIAIDGDREELMAVGIITGIVSVAAAWLVGNARFSAVGGWAIALGWLLLLTLVFRWFQRDAIFVGDKKAILVTRYPNNTFPAPQPFARPLFPFWERRTAEIPLYELDRNIRVTAINTRSGQNIDAVAVQVRFKVIDAMRTYNGITNQTVALSDIAKSIGKNSDEAKTDIQFWERLLGWQIDEDVDDVVRKGVYNYNYEEIRNNERVLKQGATAVDAYIARDELADQICALLEERTQRYGVDILQLELEHFEVDKTRFGKPNADAEREAARIRTVREAETVAETERIRRLVHTLQEANVPLTPQLIEDIVVSAVNPTADIEADTQKAKASPIHGPTQA